MAYFSVDGDTLSAYPSSMIMQKPTATQKKEAPLDWYFVRAHFVRLGTSYKAWSLSNGYHPSYVEMAGRGKRRGPKARRIVEHIKREIGL